MTNAPARRHTFRQNVWRSRYLYCLFLPIFAYYIVFHYVPIPGALIAFRDFQLGHGLFGGEWVGLKYFRQFLSSFYAYRIVRNTVLLSAYSILYGFPVPILFALCVTEIRGVRWRRTVQTVSYLPHFISTVVLVGMMKNMFSIDNGLVNQAIAALGGTRINFFMAPSCFRSLYVGSGIWQSFGYSSIIYIAAIIGIDPSLYESAKIDGITKFGEARHITIPLIMPTILILFILRLGSIISVGFEKVYLMYNSSVYETADVISTYVYRKGIESSQYGFASAVGLFNAVINFSFVVAANGICRRVTQASLW